MYTYGSTADGVERRLRCARCGLKQNDNIANMTILGFSARIVGMIGRPCKIDTVAFRRPLTPVARAVLLAAGAGDLSQGWHEILAIYQHLHALGYRPGMRPENIRLVKK